MPTGGSKASARSDERSRTFKLAPACRGAAGWCFQQVAIQWVVSRNILEPLGGIITAAATPISALQYHD